MAPRNLHETPLFDYSTRISPPILSAPKIDLLRAPHNGWHRENAAPDRFLTAQRQSPHQPCLPQKIGLLHAPHNGWHCENPAKRGFFSGFNLHLLVVAGHPKIALLCPPHNGWHHENTTRHRLFDRSEVISPPVLSVEKPAFYTHHTTGGTMKIPPNAVFFRGLNRHLLLVPSHPKNRPSTPTTQRVAP